MVGDVKLMIFKIITWKVLKLNIFEVPAGENVDTFEIQNKG